MKEAEGLGGFACRLAVAQGFGHVPGRRLKRRLLNRYCIVGMSESVTRKATKTHMDKPGHGTEYYIRIIQNIKERFMARAGFAESFGFLRKIPVF